MKDLIFKLWKLLRKKTNPKEAAGCQRFFKTGPGQYGEGNIFLGISVPELRLVSKQFKHLSASDLSRLLKSTFHEERMIALFILIDQYQTANPTRRKKTFDFYVRNIRYVNNWDLVDCSASHIVGHFLHAQDKSLLDKLARSQNLWARRIAIVSTFYFIRKGEFQNTFKIAKILINDKHDLIYKATGWMLREVGKRDQAAEEKFLNEHYLKMPRTMLRYAIERFSDSKRKFYLAKNV